MHHFLPQLRLGFQRQLEYSLNIILKKCQKLEKTSYETHELLRDFKDNSHKFGTQTEWFEATDPATLYSKVTHKQTFQSDQIFVN